jgi:prepilin-type processing-associated H-X9-DG protein
LAPNDYSYWPTLLVFAGYQSAPNKKWPAVFKCPSTETLTSIGINTQNKYRDGVSAADGTASWVDSKYHKISQFHKPGQTMFFIDWYQPTVQEFGSAALATNLPRSNHHSGFNVGFLDGHVRFTKMNEVPTSCTTNTFWTGL